MKFGTYFAYWEKEWNADYIFYCNKVASLGFDVLEIAVGGLEEWSDLQLADLKIASKDQGVELTSCIGLPAKYNVASDDISIRRSGIEYLKRLMNLMDQIDSRVLGGIIYAYWPCNFNLNIDKELALANSVASIKEVSKVAEDYGISLNIEVVNRFEQFLINDAREAVEFVKMVESPVVKVMLDSFHMNIEEDNIGEAIRFTGSNLGHFHIGENNRKVPGKGHIQWDEIGKALRDIDYKGAVVMEPFVKPGGTVGNDIKVFRDMSGYADERQLDAEIRDSLDFIKDKFLMK